MVQPPCASLAMQSCGFCRAPAEGHVLNKPSMSSVGRRRRAGALSNSSAKSIRVESANTVQDTDTAKIPQEKPPRAKVAQLLEDPVVRGKAFLNSVEKAHIQQAPV